MKKRKPSLLQLIEKQIELWKPSADQRKRDPAQAKKDDEQAAIIAEKLYITHAIVGERKEYKIFGYGSLLNERSRARTMTPSDVTYGTISGYRRIFNLLISQGTCLNIERRTGSVIDGAVCTIDKEGMLNFILREFQYDVIPDTTEEGEAVFLVIARKDKGHNVCDTRVPDTNDETSPDWQDVMPRLDYIQACYHGVCQLNGESNLFFTKDTVLFDEEPLESFVNELSPPIYEDNGTGIMEHVSRLREYWRDIDSNY